MLKIELVKRNRISIVQGFGLECYCFIKCLQKISHSLHKYNYETTKELEDFKKLKAEKDARGEELVRVENELGTGQPRTACLLVYMATFMVVVESVVAVAVIFLGRKFLVILFSSEENVVSYFVEMMILVSIVNLADGFLSVLRCDIYQLHVEPFIVD